MCFCCSIRLRALGFRVRGVLSRYCAGKLGEVGREDCRAPGLSAFGVLGFRLRGL